MARPAMPDTTIHDIERTLARLRHEASEGDHAPSLRTSVLTHMAWVPKRWTKQASSALEGLAEGHPSRTILLHPDPDDSRDALDADVDLRCFATGGRAVCFEVIELTLCGPRAHAPASIVMPLLVSDLPAFLRWRGDLPFGATELDQLVGVADRLIVDSSEWDDPEPGLERLPELFDLIAVSDIAWGRLEPWRRSLAALWPGIAEVEAVRVTGPRAEALLLTGWLAGRLGRDVTLEHTPAEETTSVAVDGAEVAPDHPEEESASELLSEQLEIYTRDRIYEEAARSFSRVAT
jgi:glucose-6-phosphate dehydrogenase assembly protein OpcA